MKRRIYLLAMLLLWPNIALAQSSATPVVSGYLTTAGCSTGVTSCFVQFGIGGSSTATVVANCGTPPFPYVAGNKVYLTIDTNGNVCTSATATGTFDDAAVGATNSGVPGSASYTGINIGGLLQGQTGINPSGSIFAADTYLRDGYDVSLGAKADAAWTSGSGSAIAILKTIATSTAASIPAGTAYIGDVGQHGTWSFTANAGTNLNTSLLATDAHLTSFTSANHTDLSTINTTLGTPFQAGGPVIGTGKTTTQIGSTVTTHGTFQSALASSGTRKGCMVQNTSADVEYVFFGATGSATTSNSFQLQSGQSLSCIAGNTILTDNVAISSKTTDGATYVVSSQ